MAQCIRVERYQQGQSTEMDNREHTNNGWRSPSPSGTVATEPIDGPISGNPDEALAISQHRVISLEGMNANLARRLAFMERELQALRRQNAGLREDNAALRRDNASLHHLVGIPGSEDNRRPGARTAASTPSTEGSDVDAGGIYDDMAVMGTRIIFGQPDGFLLDDSLPHTEIPGSAA